MSKHSLRIFLIFNFIIMTTFNLAHPVTPRMINELQLPSEMFGVFFALMSIGSYIMSPIWGSLSDYKGRKIFLIFGVLGYGLTQIGFGFSTTIPAILFFRLLGGGISVSYVAIIMAVISDLSTSKNRIKALSFLAATTSLGAAFGSILGGIIGSADYRHAFLAQFLICLILAAALFFLTTESLKHKKEGDITISNNHLKFKKSTIDFRSLLGTMILTVALLSITSTAYTSTIGYYVESVLGLPTQLNGLILSILPFVAVFMNFFVSPMLARKFDSLKSLTFIVLFTALSLIAWSMSSNLILVIIFLVLFILVLPLSQPIYQSIISSMAYDNAGEIMGIQNSARSVGMVLGSLLSGYIFNFGSKLPFLMGGLTALLAFVILYNAYQKRAKQN
ncbi:MAG TPA: MFS transporter [Firmicutes bacterium]|nr:MFS transporter [Bacillota bacterium]